MTGTGHGLTRKRFDVPLLVAGSVAFSISTMFSAMKPVLISRLVEQAHYSHSLAGLAAAMPFIGGAFSTLLTPWLIRRGSAAAVLTSFGVALAVIEAANAFSFDAPAYLLCGQFAAGVCGGVLLGLVSQKIAISSQAEQSFGIVDMVGVLMMSAMIALIGAAVDRGGLRGGFLVLAALCAAFAAIIHSFRHSVGLPANHALGETTAHFRIGWRAVAVIAMGVAYISFSGLGFAFMITAARRLGFSYKDASSAIGAILFVSATGCLAGGWCAAKVGPRPALLGAFILCALGWHVAFHAQNQIVFLLAVGLATFALQYCFPVILALAGSFDERGRLAAIAAPLIVSGFAWAAILGGVVVDRWDLDALPLVTEVGMILCALLLFAGTSGPAIAPGNRPAAPQIGPTIDAPSLR